MLTNLDTILGSLKSLSPEELETLKKRVVALQSLGGQVTTQEARPSGRIDAEQSYVLRTIRSVLQEAGVPSPDFHTMRNKVRKDSAFVNGVVVVYEFFKNEKRKETKQALIRVGVSLLYQNLKEINIPVSGYTMCKHLSRLPSVVDRAFPAYAKNKMLGMIVRRAKKEE